MNNQPKDLIKFARTQIGYVERPKKNNKYGAWYKGNFQPWCAMFVSYCMFKIGALKLIQIQSNKGFASCGAGIAFFKKNNAWYRPAKATQGDFAFFDFDHDGSQDHVGIVVKNNPLTKTITTIEGNTSSINHANGGTVQLKKRHYSIIMGVGRPDWAKLKEKSNGF